MPHICLDELRLLVAAIAKTFGGGGHTAAAGFTVDVGAMCPQPYEHVRQCLSRELAG
jgi:nanoRNase/pAp phosphatase (c-di-AMP/oligoRNAs hydrolase)